MQVNIPEAKSRLSELIKSARAGDEVVIADRGEPVVRLVPVNTPRVGVGRAGDILDWLNRHPLPAHARRSAQEIAADLKAERAAWD